MATKRKPFANPRICHLCDHPSSKHHPTCQNAEPPPRRRVRIAQTVHILREADGPHVFTLCQVFSPAGVQVERRTPITCFKCQAVLDRSTTVGDEPQDEATPFVMPVVKIKVLRTRGGMAEW